MSAHPSIAQIETLIEYMEDHPLLARNLMRSTTGRYEAREMWEELSQILNSMEGLQKTTKQWTKFWVDKKYNLKKRVVAQRNAATYRQRCGLHPIPSPLSKLECRILDMVGGDESWPKLKTESPVPTRIEEPVDESQPGPASPVVSHKGSQTDATSLPRRSPRTWVRRQRSQVTRERQRLINIEQKRVAAETAHALGFREAVRALDNLARAVIQCGQTIAEALNNLP